MKTSKLWLLAIVVVLAGAVLFNRSFAQVGSGSSGAGKIGVCDVVQIFNSYDRTKDLNTKQTNKIAAMKAEDDMRVKAIEAIRMELEGLKVGSNEFEKRRSEGERLTIERAAWLKFKETQILRDYATLSRDMYKEILAAVKQVASEQGYELILCREPSQLQSESVAELRQEISARKVLYASGNIDVTDHVLARLNQLYRNSKQ